MLRRGLNDGLPTYAGAIGGLSARRKMGNLVQLLTLSFVSLVILPSETCALKATLMQPAMPFDSIADCRPLAIRT